MPHTQCASTIDNMHDTTIQFNSQSTIKVTAVGNEKTPVIVMDEFALDTSSVIDYACKTAGFGKDSTSVYPGVRAKPTRQYLNEVLRVVVPILVKIYAVPMDRRIRSSTFYSLIATPPERLQILQRLPHFDSNRKYYFAMTHFLNRQSHGGTGLFRHKPTGYETITEDRVTNYIQAGDEFLLAHGDPAEEYFTKSTDHYELYETIEYRPNRLVAYPGCMLHSGLINPQTDINSNPETGRLTGNFFVDFQ